MALIKCEECEKEYSDKAATCPGCGCPTVSNTINEKRKNIKECSVKIKGDEKFHPPIGWRIWRTLILIIVGCILIQAFIFVPSGNTEAGVIFLILGIVIMPVVIFIAKRLPSYKKDKQDRIVINEYFQNRFSILDSLPSGHAATKVISVRQTDHESLMFDTFMEAYKFNADAIVINDSKVSTHVRGSTSNGKGSTSSYNVFHSTATLVKY